MIAQETQNHLLENFSVPDGYRAEISTIADVSFGFCYPTNWNFSNFPQSIHYGLAVDQKPMVGTSRVPFRRNVNVIIDDLRQVNLPLKELYSQHFDSLRRTLRDSKIVFKEEDVIISGLLAHRGRADWTNEDPQGNINRLACYQTVVADKKKEMLYTITFTTLVEDFDAAKPLFDNIANTFRFA